MSADFKWYEFETRMRKMIFELIEPTIQRVSKDRERSIKLKKKVKVYDEKLSNIETLLGLGKEKSGWMEDIEGHIKALNQKVASFEVAQEGKNMKVDLVIDKQSIELESLNKRIEGIVERNKELDLQIKIVGNSLSSQGDFLTKYLESNKEDFTQQFSKILNENRHSQTKFDYVSGQIVEVTQKLSNFQAFVEKFRVTMSEMNMKIQKLANEKIENDQLMSETSKINTRIVSLLEKSKVNQDKIHEIFRYLDAYLPKEVQACVSDNFYSIPDKNFLRRFQIFEDNYIKECTSSSSIGESSTIEDIFKRAIGANQRMIKRSNDFKYTGDLKSIERMNSKNSFRFTVEEESEEAQLVPLHRVTSHSEYFNTDLLIANKAIISEELNKFKEEFSSNHKKTEIYLEMLRSETEEIKKKMQNDRNLFDKELISFSKISEKTEMNFGQVLLDLKVIKGANKDIIEALSIVFSILSADSEENRKASWIKTGEKIIESKTNNVEGDKQQVGSIKGFTGGKIRNRTGTHRESICERSELIEKLGNLLKVSSFQVCTKLEIPKQVKESVLNPNTKSRLNSSSTSRRKIFSFG